MRRPLTTREVADLVGLPYLTLARCAQAGIIQPDRRRKYDYKWRPTHVRQARGIALLRQRGITGHTLMELHQAGYDDTIKMLINRAIREDQKP